MTEDQLCGLHAEGHVIGSHGFHNIRFDGLAPAELRREVRSSKERLEEVIGATVAYLAPPGGSEHPLLTQELGESGYSAARSVRWGIYRSGGRPLAYPVRSSDRAHDRTGLGGACAHRLEPALDDASGLEREGAASCEREGPPRAPGVIGEHEKSRPWFNGRASRRAARSALARR